MNPKAFLNTFSNRIYTLPIVILYVTEACNLKCIMCSYRDRLPDELTIDEIRELAIQLKEFGLRRIVFSGGEPLLRRDLPEICRVFNDLGVKQTLLTNGLLLAKRIGDVGPFLDELIVSIDGANGNVHNEIRGINSFDTITSAILLLKKVNAHTNVSLRTVVQKKNFRQIPDIIDMGLKLEVDGVSFLAIDVLSEAFARNRQRLNGRAELLLVPAEVAELREIILHLSRTKADLFASQFISESVSGLMHIADYFEALTNGRPFPRVYCNAPMVSAVITSKGDLLPCFFLPAVGNLREERLAALLNSPAMQRTRSDVRAYALEQCQRCVCSLKVTPLMALANQF